MANLKVKLKGVCPLLMHNGQTADPINHFSRAIKAISGKRKKVDADYIEMSRLEWYASIYVNEENQIIIPSDNIDATLINGAKKQKLGSVAKSALWVNHDAVLVHSKSGLSIDELWADETTRFIKAVKIGTSKVMRTRPVFKDWSCVIDVDYDELQLNEETVISIFIDAGRMVGIGDWRPRFGRFEVEKA